MVVELQTREVWDKYADDVIAGTIVASKLVILACKRYKDDLLHAGERGFYFDIKKARKVIKFFQLCQLTKGFKPPGRPFNPEPWQQFILVNLFGWINIATGLRRFRRCNILVARKNGKTHLMAVIGLFGLIADGEMGAEIYAVATRRDQAKLTWNASKVFVKMSGSLSSRIRTAQSSIYQTESDSKYLAMGADADSLDGLDIHFGLVDEFQNHKNRDVLERIETGMGARRQPMLFTIGTAGRSRETECWKERVYSAGVLEGTWADDSYFAFIAECDEEDNWEDETVWQKANPNLGISVGLEDMRNAALKARNMPTNLNSFKRLRLNIWTSQGDALIKMHKWRECVGEIKEVREENGVKKLYPVNIKNRVEVEQALVSQARTPYLGVDLSKRFDISALVLYFPPCEYDDKWVALPYFFVPANGVAERVKNDRVRYDVWIEQGLLMTTPGDTVDLTIIYDYIMKLFNMFGFKGIGIDPWGDQMLVASLKNTGMEVTEVTQTMKGLSDPLNLLLEYILTKKLSHLGNPILEWMAGNLVGKQDPAGNTMPDKGKSSEKIDGISALVNAINLASREGFLGAWDGNLSFV